MAARVGLLLGDPCGVGPELVAKLLGDGDLSTDIETVVIGDPRVLAQGQEIAGVRLDLPVVASLDHGEGNRLLQGPPIDPADLTVGEAGGAAGKAVLDTFRFALELAEDHQLAAICFARPVIQFIA